MCIIVEKYNNTIHSTIGKTPKEVLLGITNGHIRPEQLQENQKKVLAKHNNGSNDPPALVTGQQVYVKDKIIRAKHKDKFKKHFVQESGRTTFRNEKNAKIYEGNIKNVILNKT